MTREQQIIDIAAQYAINETDCQNGGKAASKRGLLLSAFRDGAHWADSHPQWIPVEEELPKEKGAYLFHFDDGQTRVEGYFPELHLSKCVTHWMPLPMPPKGVRYDSNND